ncbi:NUDIX hydrolase [Actinomycetospora aeridis]|uniref:NUDIX domain-containing protein n=1 Tax=Actinomycetospora aeridis TaxID=3129231 RepID=A0ABU8NAT8_9PSEU
MGSGGVADGAVPRSAWSPPRRIEFWGDTPPATAVVALAFTLVRDGTGRVLLVRRIDTGNWELPGGTIETGETATAAAVREVLEETAVAITVTGLAGVFCDPSHVVVYPESGQARQQHVTLLHAAPVPGDAGEPTPDGEETDAARWVELDDLAGFPIHPSVHRRLDHALRHLRGDADVHVD